MDLLHTDVVLSGPLRGREMAERVAVIRAEVWVLYMSGYTDSSIVHLGRLSNAVQLIGKPFSREHLARKVANVRGTIFMVEIGSNGVSMKPHQDR